LKLTITLLDCQLDIFIVVSINCEPFHLYDVDEIPDDIFKKSKEGIIAHDTKDSLSNPHLNLSNAVHHVFNRFV